MRSLRNMPYALFLSGMAAIISCIVAVPHSIITQNWIGMLVPVVFSGAALVHALASLRAKGLSYDSTLGEFNAGTKNEKPEPVNVRTTSPSFGWLFYALMILMSLSVLFGFAWIAISSRYHGQPIDGRIWIGFAMGMVLIPMAFLGIRRSRRPG